MTKTKNYHYEGQVEIMVRGVGVVSPGQEFKTDLELSHPHIKEVKQSQDKTKSKTKSKES